MKKEIIEAKLEVLKALNKCKKDWKIFDIIDSKARALKAELKELKEQELNGTLTQEIIESYGFESRRERTDHSDWQRVFTLPNGIEVAVLDISEGEPMYWEELEGVDEPFESVYLTTKKELDEFLSKSKEELYKEYCEKEGLDVEDYI